jgi:hypothetical protein
MSFAMVSGSNRRRSGRSVAVEPPPVNPMDGVAEAPRRTPKYAFAIPSTAGVPVGRVTRLTTSSTFEDLRSAVAAAALATDDGARWVLIPTGTTMNAVTNSGGIQPPRRGSFGVHPVIIAHTEWFDGSVTYIPNVRVSPAQSSAQPIIRGPGLGTTEAEAWLMHYSNIDIILVGLNMQSHLDGSRYTRAIIEHGDYFPVSLEGSGPNCGGMAIWHCTTGMPSRFKGDGTWSTGLGRVVQYNGSDFAWRDSRHTGHGAAGSNGSDRGVWGGWLAAGPALMENNHFLDPGGIAFIHGGSFKGTNSGTPAPWFCEDVEIRRNVFERSLDLCQYNPAKVLDSASQGCPWAFKNIGEIKSGFRHRVTENLFLNDYDISGGQAQSVVFKAQNQDSNSTGFPDGSNDFVFSNNVIVAIAKGGIGLSMCASEFPSVSTNPVLTFQRVEIRGNLVISDWRPWEIVPGNYYPSSFIIFTGANGPVASTREARDVNLQNNSFLRIGGSASNSAGITLTISDWTDVAGFKIRNFRVDRNVVFGRCGFSSHTIYGSTATPPATNGFGFALWETEKDRVGTVLPDMFIGVNGKVAIEAAIDTNPSTPAQFTAASYAAVQVTEGSSNSEWIQDPSSSLRTAAPGSTLLGADMIALRTMRTKILSGDNR